MEIRLGEKIKELRTRDGRTQENLADALGVTGQAVSRWETNGSYPDMEMIPSIAKDLGLTVVSDPDRNFRFPKAASGNPESPPLFHARYPYLR